MKTIAVFFCLLLLSPTRGSAQSTRIDFSIQNPMTGEPMNVLAYSYYVVDKKSEIELLTANDAVHMINSAPYPVVFSNSIEATGYTFQQSLLSAKAISEKLNRANAPAILLSFFADIYAFTHELQHADDYKNNLNEKIDAEIVKILGVNRHLNSNIILSFLEWRAYSKQIAEMEKDHSALVGFTRNSFNLNGHLDVLRRLATFVAKTRPGSLHNYCVWLEKIMVPNNQLTTNYVAIECK